jgi:hypothetical protein
MFLVTILILASMLLAPAAPVSAQDVQPPTPPIHEPTDPALPPEEADAALLAQGLVQRDGLWANTGAMILDPEQDGIEAQASLSKADKYGYRYQKVAPNWIDAYAGGNYIDPEEYEYGYTNGYVDVELPFDFKFYGYTYWQIQISRNGYITLGSEYTEDSQSPLGNPSRPNNVIAPNWQPLGVDTYDGDGIYYLTGGVEPNRWMAIEWHNFYDTFNYDGSFTFETVLYENGEILFQYDDMDYPNGGYWCSAGGIEDRDGLISLTTLKFCYWQASYTAVKIFPPAATVRLGFSPSVSGKIGAPGQVIEHIITVENLGDLGDDVLDLSYKGKWPAVLYGDDGEGGLGHLLTDTDGDKKIDIGLVEMDSGIPVHVLITIPAKSKIGDRSDSTLTATSSLNKKKNKTIKLENAVSAHFAQTYHQYGGTYIQTSGVDGVKTYQPDTYGNYPSILETASGRLLHFWEQTDCLDEDCEDYTWTVYFSVYEHDGTPVHGPVSLATLTGATYLDISNFSAAAGPYGTVGFTYAITNDEGVDNVYYITIDEGGNLLTAPVNVTNNTVPLYDPDTEERLGPDYSMPELVLTPEKTFIVSWREYLDIDSTTDIYYTVLANDGAMVVSPTQLTFSDGYTTNASNPHLAPLFGNKNLIGWSYWLRTGKSNNYKWTYYVQYQILDSFGEVVYKPSAIKAGVYASGITSTQMSNGEIVLAWAGGSYDKRTITYTIVSGKSYKKTKGPVSLKYSGNAGNPSNFSLTSDTTGNAIVTWRDYGNQSLFYALLGKGGAIKTKPMQYLSVQPYNDDWTEIGNFSNTTYYGAPRAVTVTLTATVPATTDATGKTVYLTGNFNGWDLVAMPMTRVDKTHWRITLVVNERYPMLYKYTLGDWEHVEKGKKCVEIDDRVLDVQYGTAGTMKKSDTVAGWRSVLPCTGE